MQTKSKSNVRLVRRLIPMQAEEVELNKKVQTEQPTTLLQRENSL